MPDKELKETVKICNNRGVPVKGFYTAMNMYEQAGITLQIKKDNEQKIINIVNNLNRENCLKTTIIFDENKNVELIKIFANSFNKSRIFRIIRNNIGKKLNEKQLDSPLKEVYKMHKLLKDEGINHQIKFDSGRIFNSFAIQNINSYFEFGANRVKKIYNKHLWESIGDLNNSEFKYTFKSKMSMNKKMRQINDALNNEFMLQNKELEELFSKYRKENSNEKYIFF